MAVFKLPLTGLTPLLALALAQQTPNNTATVDLSKTLSKSGNYAAGVLYGIPDVPDQIPDQFYTDIGFNYHRTGGAQLSEYGGWITGLEGYEGRINSTKSNYDTARKYGADVIILPHDIWGTDHANDSTVWPGDNGDFSDYDAFLDQLMDDLVRLNMTEGLVFDIWNEPDISIFWERSREQWIDLYVHSHQRFRANPAMDGVRISGPSLAYRPFPDNEWWTGWLTAIQGNDTIPDQYSYHLEGDPPAPDNDLQNTNVSLAQLLESHGLPPAQDVNINEYASFAEEMAGGAAWWISRLERYETHGLRGNWLGGCQLHDFLSSLVTKTGAPDDSTCTSGGYAGNGEWQVYKYAASSMTGPRANTTGSGDRVFDVHVTIDDKVRMISGVRYGNDTTYYISVEGLDSVGLPSDGTVEVQTLAFVDKGHWGAVDGPEDRGTSEVEIKDGVAVIKVVSSGSDDRTAWGYEFDVGSSGGYGQ